MPIKSKFSDTDYIVFERDLLSVLKNDEAHHLDFDGKLLINSSRYNCLIAATDVHWDEEKGDIVLVGAFRSGQPVFDDVNGYQLIRQEIELPLKECFEDLKKTAGIEIAMRLVGKAKKAVIDKYIAAPVKLMENTSLFNDGMLSLPSLELGKFRLSDREVVGLSRDEDGKFQFLCSNSINPSVTLSSNQIKLQEIQNLGNQFKVILDNLSVGKKAYMDAVKLVSPLSHTEDIFDDRQKKKLACVSLFDTGLSMPLCNAVAKTFGDTDLFDLSKHRKPAILKVIDSYRKELEGNSQKNVVHMKNML